MPTTPMSISAGTLDPESGMARHVPTYLEPRNAAQEPLKSNL